MSKKYIQDLANAVRNILHNNSLTDKEAIELYNNNLQKLKEFTNGNQSTKPKSR